MKKYLIGFLVLVLAMALAGCGAKEKLEQKAAEALVEKVMEKSGSGDVDIDGDKVTVKGRTDKNLLSAAVNGPHRIWLKPFPNSRTGI